MQKGYIYIFLVPYIYLSCCSGLIILVVLSNNIIYIVHAFKTIKTNDLIVIWSRLLMYTVSCGR